MIEIMVSTMTNVFGRKYMEIDVLTFCVSTKFKIIANKSESQLKILDFIENKFISDDLVGLRGSSGGNPAPLGQPKEP